MHEEVTAFWPNNEKAQQLFKALLKALLKAFMKHARRVSSLLAPFRTLYYN